MMLRSITFPMRTKSENKYRRQDVHASAALSKKQRKDLAKFLSQLRRPKVKLDAKWNRFAVRYIRIAVGELDYTNLVGSFKAIEDELCKWLGIDDRDELYVSEFLQQRCAQGYQGVRIEIEDLEDGQPEIVVLGPAPTLRGPPVRNTGRGRRQRGVEGRPKRKAVAKASRQRAPVLSASVGILPWKQRPNELVVSDLKELGAVEVPPEQTTVRDPQGHRLGSGWIRPDVKSGWISVRPLFRRLVIREEGQLSLRGRRRGLRLPREQVALSHVVKSGKQLRPMHAVMSAFSSELIRAPPSSYRHNVAAKLAMLLGST